MKSPLISTHKRTTTAVSCTVVLALAALLAGCGGDGASIALAPLTTTRTPGDSSSELVERAELYDGCLAQAWRRYVENRVPPADPALRGDLLIALTEYCEAWVENPDSMAIPGAPTIPRNSGPTSATGSAPTDRGDVVATSTP